MRRREVIVRAFRSGVGIAGLALCSCSLDTPVSSQPVLINIEVDKTTIAIGDSAVFMVSVRNISNAAVSLHGQSSCLTYIEAFDGQDIRVFGTNDSCSGQVTTVPIEPGATARMSMSWDGRSSAGARVSAGLYTVRAVAVLLTQAYAGPAASIRVE